MDRETQVCSCHSLDKLEESLSHSLPFRLSLLFLLSSLPSVSLFNSLWACSPPLSTVCVVFSQCLPCVPRPFPHWLLKGHNNKTMLRIPMALFIPLQHAALQRQGWQGWDIALLSVLPVARSQHFKGKKKKSIDKDQMTGLFPSKFPLTRWKILSLVRP